MTTVNGALAGTVAATAGGAIVTIVGTNFRADSQVTIAYLAGTVTLSSAGVPAGFGAFTVVSATQITFTVATGATTTGGPVNLRVVNGGQTSVDLSTLSVTAATGWSAVWNGLVCCYHRSMGKRKRYALDMARLRYEPLPTADPNLNPSPN